MESSENLSDIESDLLALETADSDLDPELVNRVFRTVHSMKGTANFIGLKVINELAHESENVLNLIRSDELSPTPAVVEALLASCDQLKAMVDDIENSNSVDVSALVANLKSCISGEAAPGATSAEDDEGVDVDMPNGTLVFLDVRQGDITCRISAGMNVFIVEVDLVVDVDEKGSNPVEFLRGFYKIAELIESYVDTAGLGELHEPLPEGIGLKILAGTKLDSEGFSAALGVPQERVHLIGTPEDNPWTVASPTPAVSAPPANSGAVADAAPRAKSEAASGQKPSKAKSSAPVRRESTVRVNVEILDHLMNLAGELVLARNQLLQMKDQTSERDIGGVSARVDQVTSELQDAIMQTRMQEVGSVFNKFPRVVRDLVKKLGKQCELEVIGQHVELDKTIIEAIGDPLTHLVRNSVDHGLEMPDVRTAAGKDPCGKVCLKAFHQGGKINISISDDGAGISAAKLKQKAVSKGLMSEEKATELTDQEAINLIFHPGFSTAEQVSDVSGRGVGMDVVRTNILNLGGTVEVETELGSGSTVLIKLPLTLAIMPSLIVRVGRSSFAVPQTNINEIIRIMSDDVAERIKRVHDAEVLQLRGELMPIIRLSDALGVDSFYESKDGAEASTDRRHDLADRREGEEHEEHPPREDVARRECNTSNALSVVIVESAGHRYGVVVDSVDDPQEIVVKPLGRHLRGIECLAGATVLGDGSIALILDVTGIASKCQLRVPSRDTDTGGAVSTADDRESQSLLIFTNHPEEKFALPASFITRIERVTKDQIDSVGGQFILQYRGKSLPLITIEDHISARAPEPTDPVNVVVFSAAGRECGVIVPRLVDIRDVDAEVDAETLKEPGIIGSIVVENDAIRIIGLLELAHILKPDWFEEKKQHAVKRGHDIKILLAEDSSFFRSQMTKVLESEGFAITGCEDGLIAWNTLLRRETEFDLVVTDIEMPNMNGLELTRKIKTDPEFKHLPVIAVTSLARDEDIASGRAAGVDDYQVKMDRAKLIASIRKIIGDCVSVA